MDSVGFFALDLVSDAMAIIETYDSDGVRITFANKSFVRNVLGVAEMTKKLELDDFLNGRDEQVFKEAVRKLLGRSGKEMEDTRKSFLVSVSVGQNPAKRYAVTMQIYNEKMLCCLFKEDDSKKDSVYLSWLKQFDQLSGIRASFLEYDEANKDVYQCWHSDKLLHTWQKTAESTIGKYALRESGLNEKDVQNWIECFTQARKSSLPVIKEAQFTNPLASTDNCVVSTYYCGLAATTGRPLFFVRLLEVGESQSWTDDQKNLIEMCNILKTFFENAAAPMGLIEVIDQETDIRHVFANAAAAKFAGCTVEELKGQSAKKSGIFREHFKEWLTHCKMAGTSKSGVNFQLTFQPEGKKLLQTLLFWVNYVDTNRFVYLAQDISVRMLHEEEMKEHSDKLEGVVKQQTLELKQALQVKARFLAVMSHEMRTPLSGVMGMLSLLMEGTMTEEQTDMLNIASLCAQQLLTLIGDILDLTRMEENQLSLTKSDFSIHCVLEEALEIVSYDAEMKQIEMICDIDPLLYSVVNDYIVGDPKRIRQIAVNLLSNAVKFSKQGGEVVISASLRERTVEIPENGSFEVLFSVRDTGVGISQQLKSRIFEPFFQEGEDFLTRRYEGSGLGLSICRNLVELMGGKIWYESKEGEGTTFYFTIVTKKGESPPNTYLPTSNVTTSLVGKRVLVVDKSHTLLKVLKTQISLWGCFAVKTVSSAKEAIEVLQPKVDSDEYQYDVALVGNVPEENAQFIKSLLDRKQNLILMGKTAPTGVPIPFVKKPIREKHLRQQLSKYFEMSKYTDPASVTDTEKQGFKSLRILVAEDNVLNQKVIKKILTSFGFTDITIVDNGKKVLDALHERPFDIVLMDVMMPVMSGIDATQNIRQEFPPKRQPCIIALTANTQTENLTQCYLSGMQYVLTKPVNKLQLQQILNIYAKKE